MAVGIFASGTAFNQNLRAWNTESLTNMWQVIAPLKSISDQGVVMQKTITDTRASIATYAMPTRRAACCSVARRSVARWSVVRCPVARWLL